jgi:chromosome condensin MukBEF ATPase and DNA-binding subunit MukB
LNGEQHYKEVSHWERSLEDQQKRDMLLQEYCDLNNIPLYWIRFDEIIKEKIENIINEITAVSTSDCEDNNSAKTVETEMLIQC